jgi:ribosome biogenesis GTPase A
VGKSTFINSFAGKASAKTGNKPGVTRGKQWIRLNKNLELLDTPGILWPRFEDRQVGVRLALTGAIRQELLEEQELSLELLDYLQKEYPALVTGKYAPAEGDAQWELPMDNAALLSRIAQARNLLRTGGEPDYQRAAKMVLDDFRNGKTGRITLETPPAGGNDRE